MVQPKTASLVIDQEWESHIWNLLNSQFGIPRHSHYRLLRSGRKRIRLINHEAFTHLSEVPYTGTTGLYVGEYSPNAVRLSMDGAQLLGCYATKQKVNLNAEQAHAWLQGESITYEDTQRGYVIVFHDEDILGCGSLSHGILHSFIPKVRRPKQPK